MITPSNEKQRIKKELLTLMHKASLTNDIEELKEGLRELEEKFPRIIMLKEWELLKEDSEALVIILRQLVKLFSTLTMTFTASEFQAYVWQIMNTRRKAIPVLLREKEMNLHETVLIKPRIIIKSDETQSLDAFKQDITTITSREQIKLADIHQLQKEWIERLRIGVEVSKTLSEQAKMMIALISGTLPEEQVLIYDKTRNILQIRKKKDITKQQNGSNMIMIL